jgi:hypothetical protein
MFKVERLKLVSEGKLSRLISVPIWLFICFCCLKSMVEEQVHFLSPPAAGRQLITLQRSALDRVPF